MILRVLRARVIPGEEARLERFVRESRACAQLRHPNVVPLHAYLPYRHVDHVHPDAVIAIAAARRSRALPADAVGDGQEAVEETV